MRERLKKEINALKGTIGHDFSDNKQDESSSSKSTEFGEPFYAEEDEQEAEKISDNEEKEEKEE